jgi:glycosyltransferase involved in cell wall biosynthesis
MKVSIITATYNRADTIERAIRSIKDQTYQDLEMVIVDGASSDNTLEIVYKLTTAKDKVLSEKDDGIYDALNKGLANASGDIIGFLHSDDLYADKNVLTFITDVFLDEKVDIVYGDVTFFSKRIPEKIIRRYKSDLLNLSNLAWGKMPAHPAIFCRREVFKSLGGFKLDYKIAADYEFLCRLMKNSNFVLKYANMSLVRMQTGGASGAGLKNTVLLNREVYRALKENGIYTNYFMILSKYFSKFLQYVRS